MQDNQEWTAVWELYEQHRDSLLAFAASLMHRMPNIAREDAADVVHSFVLDRLPRISVALDGLQPEKHGAYVRASFRNYLYTWYRGRERRQLALNRLRHEVALEPEAPSRGLADDVVLRSLDGLSDELVRAVAGFLGLVGPQLSIRQIAEELHVSRYQARKYVLDGLLAIVLRLGRGGSLTANEVEAVKQVVIGRKTVEQAAESLDIAPSRVRSALHTARESVAIALTR